MFPNVRLGNLEWPNVLIFTALQAFMMATF